MRTFLFFLGALSAVTSKLVLRMKRDDQGLAAHAAAERAVLAQQLFTGLVGPSGVIGPPGRKKRADQGLASHAAAERAVIAQQSFTGLVGPSGNIGPSGLCGPSGCIQFGGRNKREDQGLAAHDAAERAVLAQQLFTGLVGPSGVIGPSGLCGPSGCIQFGGRKKRADQGLAAHAAAERAVIAQQSFTGLVGPSGNIGPSGLCGPSGCIQFGGRKKREDQGLAAHAAAERAVLAQQLFTGLVGASGVIGPSGLCGPSGCIQFGGRKKRADQGLAAHAAAERAVLSQQLFTGLVGPSGNIGPSGLCGPSGCIQF